MTMLKNLSRRERTWLLLGVLFVVIAGADRLILMPVRAKARQTDVQISATRTELAALKHNAAQKSAVSDALEAYRPYMKRLGSDEKETSWMLETIERLASTSSVTLIDTKPREPEDSDWYKRFAVEIEAESTPEQLVKFLRRLNTTSDALRVDRLQVSAKERDSPFVRSSALVSKITGSGTPEAL